MRGTDSLEPLSWGSRLLFQGLPISSEHGCIHLFLAVPCTGNSRLELMVPNLVRYSIYIHIYIYIYTHTYIYIHIIILHIISINYIF